ncbi:MAG: acylphosphatase [Proteobacteria bacterium]|nr:acylphosphatase [Pseudomonadota bacterium]
MDSVRTVHVRIKGRVQGVGYRAWVESMARTMALTGWVRNRRDGSVEITLQGSADRIDEMLRLCKHGPPDARVTKVEILGKGTGAFDDFEVLPTI